MQDAALPESPCARKPICTADAPDEALWPRSCLFLALNSLLPRPPVPHTVALALGSVPLGAPGGWPRLMSQGTCLVRSSPGFGLAVRLHPLLRPPLHSPPLPSSHPCSWAAFLRPGSAWSQPRESQPSEGGAEHRVGLSKIHVATQAWHHCHWWDRLCTQVFSTKL